MGSRTVRMIPLTNWGRVRIAVGKRDTGAVVKIAMAVERGESLQVLRAPVWLPLRSVDALIEALVEAKALAEQEGVVRPPHRLLRTPAPPPVAVRRRPGWATDRGEF